MTVTELIAELQSRGARVDKPLANYNHSVVRMNARVAVIPTSDVESHLAPVFIARVLGKLGVQS